MRNFFGTDGVRGVANIHLTPELAFKLGRTGGYILTKGQNKPRVVIGKDTRLSGEMLEASLISGLLSVGIDVVKLGVVPTPTVAYITKNTDAQAGIMISASHNPFQDNGIKFFNADGFKLPDEIEAEIEANLDKSSLPRPSHGHIGRVIEDRNGIDKYISFLKSTIDIPNLSSLSIVLDCANGAATTIAPRLFNELGAEVTTLFSFPNGVNINVDCGSTHPESLAQTVLDKKADLGLAFDGDADRLIAVDNKGNIVDGDQILFVCAKSLKEKQSLFNDTVVSTVMSNFGFKKALNNHSIQCTETKVGDKYVLEEMKKHGYTLGGEQSGHIIFGDYITTGDGILSALQLASVIIKNASSLNQLTSEFKKFPQLLLNVDVEDKNAWETNPIVQNEIEKAEKILNGNGRILVRASGTENIVRVMVEAENQHIVTELTHSIADVIKQQIS